MPGDLKRQQIVIDGKHINKTKLFIRELIDLGISSGKVFFDKLKPGPLFDVESMYRKTDEGMDLEKFLSKLTSKSRTAIQLGTSTYEQIRFYTEFDDIEDDRKTTRFLFYECIFNPINNRAVKDVFSRVYGIEI
jgi:hypothetical protein